MILPIMKVAYISVLILSIALNISFLFNHRDLSANIVAQRQLSLGLMEQNLHALASILNNKTADSLVRKAYERRFIGIGFVYWAHAVNASQIAASPTFEAAFRVHLELVQGDMKQYLADPLIVDGWIHRGLADAVRAAWNCAVVPDEIIRDEKSYASSKDAFSKWVLRLCSVPK
jgi:hypothetical protein